MLVKMIELWREFPWFIKWPVEFFINIILIRGILGSEITTYVKEKGLFKGGILHNLGRLIKGAIINSERKLAIYMHYNEKHSPKLRECLDGQCSTL